MLASLERFIVQVWLTFLERLAGLESAGWGSQAETREGLLLSFRPTSSAWTHGEEPVLEVSSPDRLLQKSVLLRGGQTWQLPAFT